MGKVYCCVVNCHNLNGKLVNGKPVSLHRFPVNRKLRKLWISRVSRRNWRPSPATRICSIHFEGNAGPTKEAPLPTLFPHKVYTLRQLSDAPQVIQEKENFKPDQNVENSVSGCPDENAIPVHFKAGDMSALDISFHFHDYLKEFDSSVLSPQRNIITQTKPSSAGCSTQTYTCGVVTTRTIDTQTPIKTTNDIGVQVNLPVLTAEDLSCEDDYNFYTGLPNEGAFNVLFDAIKEANEADKIKMGRKRKMRLSDEFFMVLMRLRLGLLITDLSYRFCVSKASCSRIINEWIDFLHMFLSPLLMWSPREAIRCNMPSMFKRRYPNCRVIIDCTELFTETPQSLANRSLMYSDYKSHMTWKLLLGISPSGVITFVSDLYTGSISDKQITKASGLLDKLEAGDAVMADKGFLIADFLTPLGVHLIIPPKRKSAAQMTRLQVEQTRRIANLRIHVERAMERIKNFRIIQGVIPISITGHVSKIVHIICALSNMQPPLINDT